MCGKKMEIEIEKIEMKKEGLPESWGFGFG
jgi:hypothetical protein